MSVRVLVAGVGNELLGDDGFGIAAARAYAASGPGAGIRVVESGIAGIGLVQDLMDPFDGVIVLDAVERGAAAGTIHVLALDVPGPGQLSGEEREVLLADMHHTVPARAMVLARALGVLPPHAYLVGCEPSSMDLEAALSPAVASAVPRAVEQVDRLIGAISARQPARPALAEA